MTDLKFVLEVSTPLFRTVVAVSIALQKVCRDESVGGIGRGVARKEVGETGEPNHSGIGPLVPRVKLGIGETSAKGKCVLAANPAGVD